MSTVICSNGVAAVILCQAEWHQWWIVFWAVSFGWAVLLGSFRSGGWPTRYDAKKRTVEKKRKIKENFAQVGHLGAEHPFSNTSTVAVQLNASVALQKVSCIHKVIFFFFFFLMCAQTFANLTVVSVVSLLFCNAHTHTPLSLLFSHGTWQVGVFIVLFFFFYFQSRSPAKRESCVALREQCSWPEHHGTY